MHDVKTNENYPFCGKSRVRFCAKALVKTLKSHDNAISAMCVCIYGWLSVEILFIPHDKRDCILSFPDMARIVLKTARFFFFHSSLSFNQIKCHKKFIQIFIIERTINFDEPLGAVYLCVEVVGTIGAFAKSFLI